MTTYSVCKGRYADPSSWRYGTVDGVVFQDETGVMFLYALVFDKGVLEELQIYPCAEDWAGLPKSFDGLRELFEARSATAGEAMEIICAERLSLEAVIASLKKDVEKAPRKAQRELIGRFKGCFQLEPA